MRRIAIINQKGGVGKTTTAVNLSAALAEAGNRVWLIDLDPQAHASLHLGFGMEEDYVSMYDVLTEDVSLNEVCHLVGPNLWLSPSHIDLAAAEMELAGAVGREIILRDKMAEVTQDFDYIIFDCPPSLGILTLNALTTSEEVFLPLQPHYLALHGLSKLLRTIELVSRRLNPVLRLSSVIYCLFDTGTRLANEVVGDVETFFAEQRNSGSIWENAYSFDTKIRRNIRLAEAPSFGQSIFQYAGDSNGAQDYRSLAEEVMRQTEDLQSTSQVTSPRSIQFESQPKPEAKHKLQPKSQLKSESKFESNSEFESNRSPRLNYETTASAESEYDSASDPVAIPYYVNLFGN